MTLLRVLSCSVRATKPGPAGARVERQLGGVEDEMVLGMYGDGKGGEADRSALESSVRVLGVADAGPPPGLLDGKLDAGRGVGGDQKARLGLGHRIVIPLVDEGEPRRDLERPGDDLLVLGGVAELERCIPALLG